MQASKLPCSHDHAAQNTTNGNKRIGGNPTRIHNPRHRYFQIPTAWTAAHRMRKTNFTSTKIIGGSIGSRIALQHAPNAAIPIDAERKSSVLNFTPAYSHRSATIGSIRAARRAGT
jgi:hypothetical protein